MLSMLHGVFCGVGYQQVFETHPLGPSGLSSTQEEGNWGLTQAV